MSCDFCPVFSRENAGGTEERNRISSGGVFIPRLFFENFISNNLNTLAGADTPPLDDKEYRVSVHYNDFRLKEVSII